MYKSLPYKTKQFLFLSVKLAIIVGAFYFIYNRVVYNEQIALTDFLVQLEKSSTTSGKTIAILLPLTLLNWCFEILKWQALTKYISNISFAASAKQCLGSLTASLFTPNRIGEYGAKAIYFKKGSRRKAMLLNLLGNSAQMAATTTIGTIALVFFFTNYEVNIEVFRWRRMLYVLIFAISFVFLGKRYGSKKIRGFYLDKIIDFIKKMPFKIHFKNLLFSFIRYGIFSFQFYFLLTVFNVEISYNEAMLFIASTYLLASLVPSLAFFDWLIKGSVAIWVFSFYPVNEIIIVTVTSIMWILNFAIPAIFGSYFVLNFDYKTVFETEKAEA